MDANRRRHWTVIPTLVISSFATGLNLLLFAPLLVPISREFGIGEGRIGQLATFQAVIAAVSAVAVAPWLDRHDRGLVLRLELGVLGLGTVLSVLAPNLTVLALGRALAGLGGGFVLALCLAIAGDAVPDPVQRNRSIGVVWTATLLASLVGLPILNQAADLAGWRWAMAAMLVPVGAGFLGACWMPSTPVHVHGLASQGWLDRYRVVLRHRPALRVLAASVVLYLVWGGWFVYLGAFATTRFRLDALALSTLFVIGAGADLAASNLAPSLLRRWPARGCYVGASLIGAVSLLAAGTLPAWPPALIAFVVVASLCSTALGVVANVLLLDALPSAPGAAMALQSAGMEVGWGAGAALAGGLRAIGGYGAVYSGLGLVLPLGLIPLVARARRRAAAPGPGSTNAPAG